MSSVQSQPSQNSGPAKSGPSKSAPPRSAPSKSGLPRSGPSKSGPSASKAPVVAVRTKKSGESTQTAAPVPLSGQQSLPKANQRTRDSRGGPRVQNSKGSNEDQQKPRVKQSGQQNIDGVVVRKQFSNGSHVRAKNSKGGEINSVKRSEEKKPRVKQSGVTGSKKRRRQKNKKGQDGESDRTKKGKKKSIENLSVATGKAKSTSGDGNKKDTSSLSTDDVSFDFYLDQKKKSEALLKSGRGPVKSLRMKKSSGATPNMKNIRRQKNGWPRGCRQDGIDYASFLDRHFEDNQPGVNKVEYTNIELTGILKDALRVFKDEPILIDVKPPVTIVGDIHGQFNDLINMFVLLGRPPMTKYVFLGDYVDRGVMSIECICLLLAYKVVYPRSVTLLRGNHECARINRNYGFLNECKIMFGRERGEELWADFNRCFNEMPVCAVIATKIMCMHGGLSPDLADLDVLRELKKPVKNPSKGLVNDLLWSDPDPTVHGWRRSSRGSGFVFGNQTLRDMCHRLGLEMVVRAHQLCLDGYYISPNFYLVTIFSAPMYCNLYRNAAAFLKVDKNLRLNFITMVPEFKGCREMILKQNRTWNNAVDNIPRPVKMRIGRFDHKREAPRNPKMKWDKDNHYPKWPKVTLPGPNELPEKVKQEIEDLYESRMKNPDSEEHQERIMKIYEERKKMTTAEKRELVKEFKKAQMEGKVGTKPSAAE